MCLCMSVTVGHFEIWVKKLYFGQKVTLVCVYKVNRIKNPSTKLNQCKDAVVSSL